MLDIFNISNYKKCREKQYKSYFCLPERGSYIINKLDKTEEWLYLNKQSFYSKDYVEQLQCNNYKIFEVIQQHGKIVDNKSFVISGVVGELDLISFSELCSRFTFADGSPITREAIISLMHNNKYIDWAAIISKTTMLGMAYPVNSSYVNQLLINNKRWNLNIPGIDHGCGDFIVCYTDNYGNPIQDTLRVINGIEFKEKFDNRGWIKFLSTKDTIINMPEQIVPIENFKIKYEVSNFKDNTEQIKEREEENNIANIIDKILDWCKRTIHNEIAWEYKRNNDNSFTVMSGVIERYRVDNNCTHIVSDILIQSDVIIFKTYNVNVQTRTKTKASEFRIVIDNNIEDNLINNVYIYFGIIGYIRGDVASVFSILAPLTKDEYDGVERYTMASGGINRLCRGTSDAEELIGENRADNARSILQIDRAEEKSMIVSDILLFRGAPLMETCKIGKCTPDTLDSAVIQNTAFNSTSLNIHASISFALPYNKKEGVIHVIRNNIGINALYVGNIAGWKEQYEVLVDRCYDLKNDNFMLEIKTNKGLVKVYNSSFILHKPLSQIGAEALIEKGIHTYNSQGKTDVSDYIFTDEMHKAFDILRRKGLTNIQLLENAELPVYDCDGVKSTVNTTHKSYIVLQGNIEKENNQITDIVYGLDIGIVNRLVVYIIYGDKDKLRNYWIDQNRNNGKTDYNFKWSTYAFNGLDDSIINNIYSIDLSNETTAQEIADIIYNNIIYSEDAIAFPLLDIARYFGQVLQQFIVQEGFIVKQGYRIDRIGAEDKPQDGYVPVKFRIDGDNDDDLLIQINFRRVEVTKLQVKFRGKSSNGKVDETRSYIYNQFNTEIANDLAFNVLYTFVDKLKLSCMNKIDRFIENYCIKNRYISIKVQTEADKTLNNEFTKMYRIVKENKAYDILSIKNTGGQFRLIVSNKVSKGAIDFDYTNTMRDIGKLLRKVIEQLD